MQGQDDSPSDVLIITSYLDSKSTNIRVIETIVPDMYFYATNIGTALAVSGTVVVQLVGSRRRHLVKLEINDETKSNKDTTNIVQCVVVFSSFC